MSEEEIIEKFANDLSAIYDLYLKAIKAHAANFGKKYGKDFNDEKITEMILKSTEEFPEHSRMIQETVIETAEIVRDE
jgi:hypothetical protein